MLRRKSGKACGWPTVVSGGGLIINHHRLLPSRLRVIFPNRCTVELEKGQLVLADSELVVSNFRPGARGSSPYASFYARDRRPPSVPSTASSDLLLGPAFLSAPFELTHALGISRSTVACIASRAGSGPRVEM